MVVKHNLVNYYTLVFYFQNCAFFTRFTSNYFDSGQGFKLSYESTKVDNHFVYRIGECGGNFTYPNGFLTSPSYPENYQSYEDCVYTISRPRGTVILLKLHVLDMERCGKTCKCDYMEIRDGGSADSPVLKKLCGDKIPDPIKSSHNEVWIG